ncbi:MAG: CDP-alcohol phosphatidyltransferase family protein [Methylocystis sp.]|nr:CDP-alcohol phosphatidyltransferase family protein [Methylocystis sp.]MBI3274629.1 CDP-alcohol phosphatidyltransferase family protein [Methylocystis sp.]
MCFPFFRFLPNFISIGRLLLTPVAIDMILAGKWLSAFLVFVIAGASDALDGWLAKTFYLRSELGAMLDPLADKVLLVSVYVTTAAVGVIPAWLAILVVSRDVMIVGGVVIAWLLGRPMKVKPLYVSKATTASQLVLAAGVLGGEAFGLNVAVFVQIFALIVAALTVASASVYLWRWVEHMGP